MLFLSMPGSHAGSLLTTSLVDAIPGVLQFCMQHVMPYLSAGQHLGFWACQDPMIWFNLIHSRACKQHLQADCTGISACERARIP